MYCTIALTKPSNLMQKGDQDTLKQDTLVIDTVVVTRGKLSPLEEYELKKENHKEIYFLGDNKNMVTLPTSGGLAVNIQKLYNHLSRRGKGSRHLQKLFDKEYEQDLVNEMWEPLIKEYSHLSGDTLRLFVIHAKPSYAWISKATHYEQVAYVLKREKSFLDSISVLMDKIRL
ncbi:hypothetical protein [Sphingobacterium sp. UT-1RO-CII-1]|uniref:hypothetical protein n=1 Tax=Sphingobacterium sp. UT-1RO-CII-1 TaxID=2995225 RepID=UPI002279F63E|nr:hypothetical protein [Sphingobacterium sp. UT-1RO-CII-1]